jgi:hypothetical protein
VKYYKIDSDNMGWYTYVDEHGWWAMREDVEPLINAVRECCTDCVTEYRKLFGGEFPVCSERDCRWAGLPGAGYK